MKILNYPITKLTVPLIGGIYCGFTFPVSLWNTFIILAACLALLIVFRLKSKIATSHYFGIFILFIFFVLGCINAKIHTLENPKHYSYHYKNGDTISFRIYKKLKSTNYSYRYQAHLLKINEAPCMGKVLLNIYKDSSNTGFKPPKIDYLYQTTNSLTEITPPLNPHQFNYKAYLAHQGIYSQLKLGIEDISLKSTSIKTVQGIAGKLRDNINKVLKTYPYKTETAILNALLLGQRDEINSQTYQDYASAGAIQLLAISGLHIGIILLILQFLLAPLKHTKYGRVASLVLILACLWSFAVLTGLSASVVRAVTMFSFISYALQLKKGSNIYHAIISSMFILLLFWPAFIFDVGFQLSYIAVFGIVWIQPLMEKYWSPKHRITNYFWKLITVSFAAQLSVLPLSLYYFHQFPGLFFLSNIVLIPFMGTILGLGIIVIILAGANSLPYFLGKIFFELIGLMNSFVGWVAGHEAFVFKEIPFNFYKMAASYILIIAFVSWLKKRKQHIFLVTIGSSLLLIVAFLYEGHQTLKKERLVIFHKSRNSLWGTQHGNRLLINDTLYKTNSTIKDFCIGENINDIAYVPFKKNFSFKNYDILIIDSTEVNYKNLHPDIVLLANSPKINLERFIKKAKPKRIIADGSNYKFLIALWKASCKKEKLPFHYTGEMGACIIE
ncbi:ComEC/Rec2 family competence protein [Galbibacter sp. PAP.153]|uniref:ComEC/Rec2 family competence protein n=1 Tax=Galbibacter sp. PAP.153 TaxID=3104623 RepID=UPI00300BDC98